MTQEEAKNAAKTFQRCGWDVEEDLSQIGPALKGRSSNGDGYVYGFSHNDMKVLVLGGQVATKR